MFHYNRFVWFEQHVHKEICTTGAPNKPQKLSVKEIKDRQGKLTEYKVTLYKKCSKLILKLPNDHQIMSIRVALQRAGIDLKDKAVLWLFAKSPIWQLRLISCRTSNQRILKYLSTDKHGWVRHSVAGRTKSPAVLRLLAKDPSWSIRTSVAGNPRTPPDARLLLARDPSAGVRRRLMMVHDNLSKKILSILSRDSDPWTRKTAQERLAGK